MKQNRMPLDFPGKRSPYQGSIRSEVGGRPLFHLLLVVLVTLLEVAVEEKQKSFGFYQLKELFQKSRKD